VHNAIIKRFLTEKRYKSEQTFAIHLFRYIKFPKNTHVYKTSLARKRWQFKQNFHTAHLKSIHVVNKKRQKCRSEQEAQRNGADVQIFLQHFGIKRFDVLGVSNNDSGLCLEKLSPFVLLISVCQFIDVAKRCT
jgi:hypothetical protein